MKKVARNFTDDTDRANMSGVKFSIVAANNHYAGFATATVNIFRQLLGLEEVQWGDKFIATDNLERDDDVDTDRRVKTKQPVYPTFGNKHPLVSLNLRLE